LRSAAALLALSVLFQPVFALVADAQGRAQRATRKPQGMSENQRIAQVLSRLTFGARPGDFERVKAMGVEAFIAQQLDPDSLGDGAVDTKLAKFPTLAMATPVIFEQYTPPKPAPAPSPTPMKPADKAAVSSPNLNSPNAAPTIASSAAALAEAKMDGKMAAPVEAAQGGAKNEVKKEDAGRMPALPAASPAAKPTPPPKNPQMVVTELQRAALLRAVYSDRQLNELMVDFWENHFSIFAYKDADRYMLTSFDRDTIRPFAMGRFRDLLGATARSPAMLFYLDNWQSSVLRNYPATKDKPARQSGGINENYARELMELHTLGVDGGYTQQDVQEVARCFTGWTIQKPNEEGLFLFRPGAHDNGEKVVLGHRIPAGGGIGDAERVLDILATQPATAHFIALKLARHFISDDPPPAVVDRAAEVFLKTDGSIRETLRAIITSPEFFAPAAYRAKVRTPFEYEVAALRALNAESDADPAVVDWTRRMGQQGFGRLTPDGFPDRAEQWLSTGSLLERFNFAVALAANRLKGTKIDIARLLSGADTGDKEAVAAQLVRLTLLGDVSPETRAALEKSLRAESAQVRTASGSDRAPTTVPANLTAAYASNPSSAVTVPAAGAAPTPAYIPELITLLIGSPEFQKR
jgi:uncharacterized protein (DUF1800 family)